MWNLENEDKVPSLSNDTVEKQRSCMIYSYISNIYINIYPKGTEKTAYSIVAW